MGCWRGVDRASACGVGTIGLLYRHVKHRKGLRGHTVGAPVFAGSPRVRAARERKRAVPRMPNGAASESEDGKGKEEPAASAWEGRIGRQREGQFQTVHKGEKRPAPS